MFSVNTHSVHHSNGRDEIVQDFNTFCQIYDVTRHNVHFGHVFHASRRSGVTQGKKHIVAAVAGCRKPLVTTGWAVSSPLLHKWAWRMLLPLCMGCISSLTVHYFV